MLVFAYGTLTDPDRASAVLEEFAFAGEATLRGLRRVDGEYPTLAPGGEVEGRLVETPEVERLDAYEGVDAGLYVRVEVPIAAGGALESTAASVYVGDPERLGAQAAWPGEGDFEDRVRAYLADHDAAVVPSAPPDDRQG